MSTEVPKRGASTKHVDKYVATVHDQLKAALKEAQTEAMADAQQQKWYYDLKIGTVDLKPGDLVIVKADAFQGKRKIKDRGRTSLTRWCVRLWQMSPHTKWWTNMDSHASYTTTDSFLLCQKLVFPCAWVSAKHGTDVPAPPQLSLLPRGVEARLCHEKIVAWQSPSIRPGRLPWGDWWEAVTSPVDTHQSIHWGWVKTSGNV